jgi:hypothetical protein
MLAREIAFERQLVPSHEGRPLAQGRGGKVLLHVVFRM